MKYFSKQLLSILLISVLLLFGAGGTAHAESSDCTDAKLRDLGVAVLSCNGDANSCKSTADGSIITQADSSACACKISNVNLTGNDNPEKAFRYFLSKGLSAEQSAAIVGNMMQESGVDPQRVQNGAGPPRSSDPHAAGNLGWGIIQWTPGAKVLNIAKSAGLADKPIDDLGTQLDLVWWHLQNETPTGAKNVLPALKTQATVESAVQFFLAKVEGTTSAPGKRLTNAKEILAKYGGGVQTAATPAGSPAPASCGSAGQFIDGFVVYSQYDPAWKNKLYGTSTIGDSGCGPSAMAMIITALTGTKVTPDQTAEYAGKIGMYIAGAGSSWAIAPRLAEKWGLKSEAIGKDLAKITSALQQGKLVITSGSGAVPFTSGGHYIVIRGITADGKFKVGDSAHPDANSKDWDPAPILSNMNAGSVYAISK